MLDDGARVLGFPKDINDPMEFFEQHLKVGSKGQLLTFLARRITNSRGLPRWYDEGYFNRIATFHCYICGQRVHANQKTYGKKTNELFIAHGNQHFEEALQGKFKDIP